MESRTSNDSDFVRGNAPSSMGSQQSVDGEPERAEQDNLNIRSILYSQPSLITTPSLAPNSGPKRSLFERRSRDADNKKPPKLDTSTLNVRRNTEPSPLSAQSTVHTLNLIQLSKKLDKANYLPSWLAHLVHSTDPAQVRHALQHTYRKLDQIERDRIVGDREHRIYSRSIGTSPENIKKNRYTDIIPFDNNIVYLSNGQYVNASYLDTLDQTKKYIASQGPLPHTFGDFWNMVLEQNVHVIVMLTQEEENGRIKCHRYWPGESPIQFGSMTISFIRESYLIPDHVIERQFLLQVGQVSRTVTQIQVLTWIDHNVADPVVILSTMDYVNQIVKDTPMIVHCSAGCGRTGAYCTIDACLTMLKEPKPVQYLAEWDGLPPDDIVARQVNQFRKNRIGLVQTPSQFIFCYDAILIQLGEWYSQNIPCTWK